MGLFDDTEDEEVEENFECMYGCGEWFATHEQRLEHSMKKHWNGDQRPNLNPNNYPTMIGKDTKLKF